MMYFTDLIRSPDDSFAMLEKFRQQHQLCDITLKVGKRKLPVHKVVLGAAIPYFREMFTNKSFDCEERELTVEDIDPDVLTTVIDFAYTGKISITASNARCLFVGSSFLKMDNVKEACSNFLRKRLDVHNVFEIRSLANTLKCRGLAKAANHFVQRNFVEVAQSEEFLSLPMADVSEIIGWDELCVSTEEQVFNVVINWVKKDVESRRKMLPKLLLNVRLLLLPQACLTWVPQSQDFLRSDPEIDDLFKTALTCRMMPEMRHLAQRFTTTSRCCPDDAGCIYVISDFSRKVEQFDPTSGRWEMTEPMPKGRTKAAVASILGKLYVIGGKDYIFPSSTVQVFDPETQKWSFAASMNNIKGYTSAATLHNKIYACGGHDSFLSMDKVECYDPECDKWTIISSMSKSRSTSCIVASRDRIYVLGGNFGVTQLKLVESYDPQTDEWNCIPSMLTERKDFGAAVLKGKLYVCGGLDCCNYEFLDTAEVYDPSTKEWKFIHPMNAKRSDFALVSNGGKLYAIGGHDSNTNLNSVEVYDSENDQWTLITPMCTLRGSVKAGVIYEY